MTDEELEFILAADKPLHVQFAFVGVCLDDMREIRLMRPLFSWLKRNGPELMRQESDPDSFCNRFARAIEDGRKACN